MKRHLTVILPALALSGCFEGCASTSTTGLTKDQIAARETAREARNERWSRIAEGAGTILINLGTGWVQAKALESGSGFRK